jgi:hypothetical protein
MSREARAEFDNKYTEPRNYELLMDIYAAAIRTSPRERRVE